MGTHTRKSVPDAFSAAQSSGPNPGARATLSREFFANGLLVVGGTPRVAPELDELEGGGIKLELAFDVLTLALSRDGGTPGTRNAGTGGGGMRCASVKTRGSGDRLFFDFVAVAMFKVAEVREGRVVGIELEAIR